MNGDWHRMLKVLREFSIERFRKDWEVEVDGKTIEVGYAVVSYANPFFEVCLEDPTHPQHKEGQCRWCPHSYLCLERGEYVTAYPNAIKIGDTIYIRKNDPELLHDVSMQIKLRRIEKFLKMNRKLDYKIPK